MIGSELSHPDSNRITHICIILIVLSHKDQIDHTVKGAHVSNFDKFRLFSSKLIFYEKIFPAFNACACMCVTVGLSNNHKWSFSVFRRNIFCGFFHLQFFSPSKTNFCVDFLSTKYCTYDEILIFARFLQWCYNSHCKIKMSEIGFNTSNESEISWIREKSRRLKEERAEKRSFTIWLIISWWFWWVVSDNCFSMLFVSGSLIGKKRRTSSSK